MNPKSPVKSDFLFYTTPNGEIKIEVFFENETVWLTQEQIAEVFQTDRSNITKHLKNIYESNELDQNTTSAKFAQHLPDGRVYQTLYYNLDAIISVGYRVNSEKATQFRIWATSILRDFIIKGFVLDDERLKNGRYFGKDYFEELLEKIREIRASERRFYQKITDIFALSSDYDKNTKTTKDFFSTVQNKLHWAITGKTAAEIIYYSADSKKPHMGLTNWKNSPGGKILKHDTTVAKNYLNEKHIKELELLVSAYLDLAENRASRQIHMKMADWVKFLNRLIELSDYPILEDTGKISKLKAELKAAQEYDKYRIEQDILFESDFDKEVKKYLKPAKVKSK